MICDGWKPANGFEPMTFALQKRCSTTELSRHGTHRKHPQGEFQAVVATGFKQRTAEIAFNSWWLITSFAAIALLLNHSSRRDATSCSEAVSRAFVVITLMFLP